MKSSTRTKKDFFWWNVAVSSSNQHSSIQGDITFERHNHIRRSKWSREHPNTATKTLITYDKRTIHKCVDIVGNIMYHVFLINLLRNSRHMTTWTRTEPMSYWIAPIIILCLLVSLRNSQRHHQWSCLNNENDYPSVSIERLSYRRRCWRSPVFSTQSDFRDKLDSFCLFDCQLCKNWVCLDCNV